MRSAILTVLALNVLFTLATADANGTNSQYKGRVFSDAHPYCRCSGDACQPNARGIVDITSILRIAAGLPEGACVFNPAIVRLAGNLFCVFTRVYVARSAERRCVPGRLDRPPFMDAWNGTLANLLAVVRLRPPKLHGTATSSGAFAATVLGQRYLHDFNYEDGRLFYDQRGRLYLYLSLPFGKYGGARASVNTVFRVHISCRRDAPNPTSRCDLRLGPPRLLRYDRSLAWDKNWVPWNGTSLMSYSHYGPFGPHSVFNWSSYRDPIPRSRFQSRANESFFPRFAHTYGRLLHLSGGTPAILEQPKSQPQPEPGRNLAIGRNPDVGRDGSGSGSGSYLAVGHVRAHPGCLHPESIPGLEKVLGSGARISCGHLMTLDSYIKAGIPFRSFAFKRPDGQMNKHYHVDYGFFLYRFNASPPYTVTHISHGFIPPSEGHFGIVFPSGLERFPAGALGDEEHYAIGYGDGDQVARLLLLSRSDVEKLLIPLATMEEHIAAFSVCTLPLADDVPPALRLKLPPH